MQSRTLQAPTLHQERQECTTNLFTSLVYGLLVTSTIKDNCVIFRYRDLQIHWRQNVSRSKSLTAMPEYKGQISSTWYPGLPSCKIQASQDLPSLGSSQALQLLPTKQKTKNMNELLNHINWKPELGSIRQITHFTTSKRCKIL